MQDRAWPTNGGQVTGFLEDAQMGGGQDTEFVVLQSGYHSKDSDVGSSNRWVSHRDSRPPTQ